MLLLLKGAVGAGTPVKLRGTGSAEAVEASHGWRRAAGADINANSSAACRGEEGVMAVEVELPWQSWLVVAGPGKMW